MREIISKVMLDTGRFEVKVDITDLSAAKPQHVKIIRAYIDVVPGGYYRVKKYTTLDGGAVESNYVGDTHVTYDAAAPTLAGVFLGVLAAHEVYGDDILGHLDITAKEQSDERGNE